MPSLLLRLLLCATLLLNGTGSAMASAHLAVMGLQAEAAAMTDAAPMAADDCPHAARQDAATPDGTAAHGKVLDATPDVADADCFQRCLDLCMQQCQALIGGVAAIGASLPGAGVLAMVASGQASPLPHPLLRPPIGA
jgi:hypothetical protein